MTAHRMRFRSTADTAAEIHVETVEEYLQRGGSITSCPPRAALGVEMCTPTISVDGHTLPIAIGSAEYVPNFVCDLQTYDYAQTDPVAATHDGSLAAVRVDEQRHTASTRNWASPLTHGTTRDDADTMEIE